MATFNSISQEPKQTRQAWEDALRAQHYAHGRWAQSARARRTNRREQFLVDQLLEQADSIDSALDVPCGTGRFEAPLARHALRLWAADASHAMLSQYEGQSPRIQFSADAIPFCTASIDLVFCFRLLHHFEESQTRVHILKELARVSRRYVLVSYWDAACLQSWRHRLLGRKTKRHAIPRLQFETEAKAAGLKVVAREPLRRGVSEQVIVLLEVKP